MVNPLTHPLTQAVKRKLSLLGISPTSKVLAGVSGGVDSMVLLFILDQLGFPVSAAHVNFNLRGDESNKDALFVKQWCLDKGIPHFELSKDTKAYAAEKGLNTQSAAREIRYAWWENMVDEHQFDFVTTAHHLDDAIETVFVNLLRGTGIKGLKGIPHQRDFYIRPLIECSRIEIEAFADAFDIPFRTDTSNLTDDYQRNRIRHHLIPALEDINPGFYGSMRHTLHRVQFEWESWEHVYRQWHHQKVQPHLDGFLIRAESHEFPFVLRWLEEKGMPWSLTFDFITAVKSDSGQILTFENHKLSRAGSGFYFEEVQPNIDIIIDKPGTYSIGNVLFTIEKASLEEFVPDQNPNTEWINEEVVKWPLNIRNVRPGDIFQPIGMKGQSKKVQDLMVDLKLDMHEKERLLLLTNAEHIIWVLGIRLDERAKVKTKEKGIFRIFIDQEMSQLSKIVESKQ